MQVEVGPRPGRHLGRVTQAVAADPHRVLGRRELGQDDTLLLYVTDHGTKAKDDGTNTAITLWGPDESLRVTELRELLALLPPHLRVVMLMSQCYSGGFAHLVSTATCGRATRCQEALVELKKGQATVKCRWYR